jgi:hypothetical protein
VVSACARAVGAVSGGAPDAGGSLSSGVAHAADLDNRGQRQRTRQVIASELLPRTADLLVDVAPIDRVAITGQRPVQARMASLKRPSLKRISA